MRASPGDCPRSFATPRPFSGAQCLDVFCCLVQMVCSHPNTHTLAIHHVVRVSGGRMVPVVLRILKDPEASRVLAHVCGCIA